ncbi:MAG: alpha-amylase family protein [Planctomycetota bacterium]|jgi:hypothetical protein
MVRNVLSGMILIVTLTSMPVTAFAQQSDSADADSWWLTPHRLLQTNLREIDATMDTDKYVREVKEFGANIVLFNVGGIVANYPTKLEYHWRNTFMEGDLVGETLAKLHKADVKMIGRFDFSKINEDQREIRSRSSRVALCQRKGRARQL